MLKKVDGGEREWKRNTSIANASAWVYVLGVRLGVYVSLCSVVLGAYASACYGIWAPFLIILGAKWGPFWQHLGSKSGDFGLLGSPGGRLGAMLDPMAGQRGASSQKGTKRLTLGRPIWEPFSVLFRILGVFFGDLISSRFLEGIWFRFWRVVGSFLAHFLDVWGHFFDAPAEVENVVWTYYLL